MKEQERKKSERKKNEWRKEKMSEGKKNKMFPQSKWEMCEREWKFKKQMKNE